MTTTPAEFPRDALGRLILDLNPAIRLQREQEMLGAKRDASARAHRDAERATPPIVTRADVTRNVEAALRRHGPGAVASAVAALDTADDTV